MLTTQNTAVRGYAFSTAVDTTWGIIETGPFFVRGRTLYCEGGGWQFFKIHILAVKHLKINILSLGK